MGDANTPIVLGVTAAAVPTWRAAYSDRTAAVMARLCELAYESARLPTHEVPPRRTVAAPSEVSRAALAACLDEIGFTLAGVFTHESTEGYLAVSSEFAVLAFRGTANLVDWKINVDAVMADLALPAGRGTVRVHEGFLGAFKGCETLICELLDEHVRDRVGLYITGHSLGGGLAQVASAALERDTLAACYTFGSPRVGELAFDTVVKCPHYRVVDHWDAVPTVPPPFYRGYLHSGDPRLIAQGATAALRRDRPPAVSLATNLAGLANFLVTRKALVIQDHMIARYREILTDIAIDRRSAQPKSSTQARSKPLPRAVWAALALTTGLAAGLALRPKRSSRPRG